MCEGEGPIFAPSLFFAAFAHAKRSAARRANPTLPGYPCGGPRPLRERSAGHVSNMEQPDNFNAQVRHFCLSNLPA